MRHAKETHKTRDARSNETLFTLFTLQEFLVSFAPSQFRIQSDPAPLTMLVHSFDLLFCSPPARPDFTSLILIPLPETRAAPVRSPHIHVARVCVVWRGRAAVSVRAVNKPSSAHTFGVAPAARSGASTCGE